jgi:NADH-quinone oxidoreductase subunit J
VDTKGMPSLLILLVILGAIGLFLLLPGGRAAWARVGAVALVAAGGFALAAVLRHATPQDNLSVFIGGAAIALFAAVRVITHARPVYSALYFVLLVLAVAALLLHMSAEFLAAALVIVYAGAILVTYIFVIMYAQQAHPGPYDTRAREPLLGCLAGFVLLGLLATSFGGSGGSPAPGPGEAAGTVEAVGTLLLTQYVVGIQLVGLLLLAAMVGAIAIARRRDSSNLGEEETC